MTTPNVILLTLDSLRADHLPTYGYSRSTSPALTEFGNRSDVTVFENAFATTAWTLPSHTSLFTGLSTVRHGLYDKGLRIDPEHTLAAELSKAGYDTTAFLTNGWLTNGGVTDAFDEVVEIFNTDVSPGFVERNLNRLEMILSMQDDGADDSVRSFREWIQTDRNATVSPEASPFFAFFHLMEPHYLYNPMRPYHKEYVDQSVIPLLVKQREVYTQRGKYFAGNTSISPKQMRGFVDLYDSEIQYLDNKLAELFDRLKRVGEFKNSLIVILGDHGELFGEYDLIGHHFSLSDDLLRVPLFVKWPNESNPLATNRSEAFVSLSNIFKTVADIANIEPSNEFDRVSLQEQHANNNQRIFAHYRTPESMLESFREQVNQSFSYHNECDTRLSVVRDGSDKLVISDDDVRLYNLDTKEGETKDRSDDRPDRTSELRAILDEHLSQEPLATQSTTDFSEGVQEQLEDLGYI
ncbi:sulfatase [Halorubrum sp. Hd13]|uniref:sulfatase n=1 Tax=Halorubrum sp. Hd13 TaxID=1480728 RepID=UPI000B98F5F1|nr:sulfatase [Halorubrum sp. Hd13]OYR42848.1 hypothetical protein DJ81_10515 [Halorubrum sp. Hd13]